MRTWGPASEVSLHEVMKRLWSHVMAPGLEKHHDSVHQAEPRSCWPPTIHGLCLPTKRSGVRDVGISGYHTTSAILVSARIIWKWRVNGRDQAIPAWKPLNKACIHGQRWCIFWGKQLSLSLAFQDFRHFKLSPWHLRLTRGFVWHLGLTRVSLASNTPQTPQILWTFPMFTGIILSDIWETYAFNFQQSFFSYEWGLDCFWTNDPILISPTHRDWPCFRQRKTSRSFESHQASGLFVDKDAPNADTPVQWWKLPPNFFWPYTSNPGDVE